MKVCISHNLIVLSEDPLARIVPVLLKATDYTQLEWPIKALVSYKVYKFHNFIVLSADPLASNVLLGLNAIDIT